MRESLLERSRMISPIIVVLGMLAWHAAPALMAQAVGPIRPYTVESLHGDYAVVNHYGANLALGIGTEHFDGTGEATGSLLLNRPTATGSRELVALTSTGTYTVNSDGTGILYLEVTLPDGTLKTATRRLRDYAVRIHWRGACGDGNCG